MDYPTQHLITVNATNHHGYLIKKLWEFIQNKHKTDMCILSNGQMIQAHQVILEVFTSQEKLGYAALHDDSSNLNNILEFMYTGVIRVQPEHLDSLLHLATDLGFGMLVDALETAKSNSYQISPDNNEDENSDMMPSALIHSDNHAVCDYMPPALSTPTLEDEYSICHVKQEPLDNYNQLDQSIVEDFNMTVKQNVVALKNGEGQFVDTLEIDEEAPDIVKLESNVDIGTCSSNMVAGWNECEPGDPPVPTINESVSNCANSMSPSRYPRRKRPRKNNSKCDSLLDPDWKGSNVDSNMSSKRLSTREGAKSQLSTHGQILPADASAVGLAKTCNQKELKNTSTFRNRIAAKWSELNNANHEVVFNRTGETKCDGSIQIKIKCSVCLKEFSRCHLKRHMRVHTGERPYACLQCLKTFSDPSSLSRHMAVHTSERPHACPECPKTFSLYSKLSRHMRVHTGERPHACPLCPKSFSQSGTLSRHMTIHTGQNQNHAVL